MSSEEHFSGIEHRILRRADVEARTGFKRAHIYGLMKEGRFPKVLTGVIFEWALRDICGMRADEMEFGGMDLQFNCATCNS
jgi:predicted DNA-binding transcriptional regulator AlpA